VFTHLLDVQRGKTLNQSAQLALSADVASRKDLKAKNRQDAKFVKNFH